MYGPRNLKPTVIQTSPLGPNERYFVVSWGLDEAWGQPTEEPYIKEVKVVAPAVGDPLLEPGLALVEIVPGQTGASFKESESGSPVFNSSGQAIGIMIREWADAASGVARRGIALPFVKVASWLNGVTEQPVHEPAPLLLGSMRLPVPGPGGIYPVPYFDPGPVPDLNGSCLFLGKYSARNRDPGSEQALSDAPIGIAYLNKVIGFFPSANPNEVTDSEAVITKQLSEQESVSIPPRGAVNIRSHCPEVVPKPRRQGWERIAYYGPVLARAGSDSEIRIKSVERQAYLGDFFYWGQIVSVSLKDR